MGNDVNVLADHAGDLLVNVIVQAVTDDDVRWILSKTFAAYLKLLGFNDRMIFETRQRYLRGQIRVGDLGQVSLARVRGGYTHRVGIAWPASWPVMASR